MGAHFTDEWTPILRGISQDISRLSKTRFNSDKRAQMFSSLSFEFAAMRGNENCVPSN